MAGTATDVRSLDPAAYAQEVGLQPAQQKAEAYGGAGFGERLAAGGPGPASEGSRSETPGDAGAGGRIVAPGVGEPPRLTHDQGGKLEVEKEGWPRHKLVLRETGTGLGDSLREKIEGWGYAPEDSLGFCPNFPNRSIYFAWRRQ